MRRIIWAQSAQADYLAILRYIAADDPDAAERVADAIQKTGEDLAAFATGHPGRIGGTYEKSVPRIPYVLAYSLTDKDQTVAILRVIHAAREWNEGQWPA
ncbi:type II toxin-antitoxin system RelE/ParE family toxin [Sphingobium sp.]|uniref:type II toxin-antitoxin system RelE/ParE family toxin n=1 Tax=Sphingobium sp. TaxID=1912891 RepID=UPI003BB49ECF